MVIRFSTTVNLLKRSAEKKTLLTLASVCLIVLLLVAVTIIPVAVEANSRQQSLSSALIFAIAQESIEKNLDKSDGSIYKIECLTRLPEHMSVTSGTLVLEPQLVSLMHYNKPIQVRVAVKVNGALQLNIITTWRVRKVSNVLVAVRDIPSRTIVSADDFVYEFREVARLDDVVFDVAQIVGLETKRPLTTGSIVGKNMFGKPQVISSGDNITILSKSGVVVVQTAGQALQSGSIGDVIRVRNLGSGKTILARIESPTTVVITITTR